MADLDVLHAVVRRGRDRGWKPGLKWPSTASHDVFNLEIDGEYQAVSGTRVGLPALEIKDIGKTDYLELG
jgi:hypothetical protein